VASRVEAGAKMGPLRLALCVKGMVQTPKPWSLPNQRG